VVRGQKSDFKENFSLDSDLRHPTSDIRFDKPQGIGSLSI